MKVRPTLAVVALVAVLVAGCGLSDPTTTPGPTPPPAGEAPTTATIPATSAYAPNPAGEPADDCPVDTVQCPLPWVTPGAVIPSTAGVCTTAYNVRGYLSPAEKRRVLVAYGLPANTPVREWDHLVPRWAGGTSTSKNIFPQVDPAEVRRKDALEQRLYVSFCHPGQGKGIDPATVRAACHSAKLTLNCARQIAKEYWRWW